MTSSSATAQARGVSSRVFGIVERLASKNNGKVSETFGVAAHKLKGLVASETDNEALLANGKEVAVDAWRALREGVSGDKGALGDIGTTTSRIMHRLKDVMKQLQEDKVEAEKRREAQIAHADAAEGGGVFESEERRRRRRIRRRRRRRRAGIDRPRDVHDGPGQQAGVLDFRSRGGRREARKAGEGGQVRVGGGTRGREGAEADSRGDRARV